MGETENGMEGEWERQKGRYSLRDREGKRVGETEREREWERPRMGERKREIVSQIM